MSSRRQKLLARVNWYLQSSLKHITEFITGNKSHNRGGRYRQVSLYFQCYQCPVFSTTHPFAMTSPIHPMLWTSCYEMTITRAAWQYHTRYRQLKYGCRAKGSNSTEPHLSWWLFMISNVGLTMVCWYRHQRFVKWDLVGHGPSVQCYNQCQGNRVSSVVSIPDSHLGPSTWHSMDKRFKELCAKSRYMHDVAIALNGNSSFHESK